jgi:hypothetical protein
MKTPMKYSMQSKPAPKPKRGPKVEKPCPICYTPMVAFGSDPLKCPNHDRHEANRKLREQEAQNGSSVQAA